MNCKQALEYARKTLADCCIEDSLLEGEILVRFVLGIDRAALFAGLDEEISSAQLERLKQFVERREWGEPSAYITGSREFYGIDFKVDRRVLIPRPETELLVEKAISFCRKLNFTTIADIGTGSGCIAISLAQNLPGVKIYAVDRSLAALEVTEENISRYRLKGRIELLWGDLLKTLPEPVDIIIANLPYVKKEEVNSRYEPDMALNGGLDGMEKIREIIKQIPGKLKPGGYLLLEVGQGQAEEVKSSLHKAFPQAEVNVYQDLAGIDRVVAMCLTA